MPGLCSSGLHDPIRYIYLMKKTVFKKNNVRLDILLLSFNHSQTDAMVQTDTQYSSKGSQFEVATKGKCL